MRRLSWRLVFLAALLVGLMAFAGSRLRTVLFGPTDATWQALQERGVWRVGMDPSFPPFDFLDETGQPVGYDVDLAEALAAEMGVDVQIVALGFDSLIDALRDGKVDSVISALPFDPRLTKDVRYSESYFEAGVRLVTPIGSPIAGIEDLPGRRVAVEWGGAGDVQLRRLQKEEPTIERATFQTQEEALAALERGEVDAALVDGVTLALAQGQGAALQAVGPALDSVPYVIAMPVDAVLLEQQVNENLTKLRKRGFLQRLKDQWLSGHETR